MIELWSKDQINELLSDQDAKDLLRHIYDMQAAGETPGEFGNWDILEFTHVFEEYNSAILRHKTRNLTLIVHDGIDGFRKEQGFRRERVVKTIEWVNMAEFRKNPGPIYA